MFHARALELPLHARYNVAPSTPLIACRENSDGTRELVTFSWGFVPRWTRDSAGPRPINARAESLFIKPIFRDSARFRRCLVPADGFFEWRREGEVKQPYFVRSRDQEPFALAAVWEERSGGDVRTAGTVAIVVTNPNSLVAPLHDRMPVIVAPADFALWLDTRVREPAGLERLFQPYVSALMEVIRVSREVNSAASEGPGLIEPV